MLMMITMTIMRLAMSILIMKSLMSGSFMVIPLDLMMMITITIAMMMIVIMRNLMPENLMVMLRNLILMLMVTMMMMIMMMMTKNSILRGFMLSAKIMKESMIIAIMQANTEWLHTVSVISDIRHQKKFRWSSTTSSSMIVIDETAGGRFECLGKTLRKT